MIVQTIKVNDCTPQTIVIGRRGTYDTLQIAFDLSYLVESYSNGVAVLAVKRSQDESAYPAVTAQEDDLLLWTVSETDTYYVGAGEAQLMWYVDGGLAKTIIYPMVVMKDILMTSEEAPDAYQTWVDDLTTLGAETLQNAQNAAQSASDAEDAKDDAVAAKEAAEAALEEFTTPTASATTLPAGSQVTAAYSDGNFAFGIPRGADGSPGDPGVTPDFSIGTVTTLEPTQPATATITGTAEAPVLNLGIPKGTKGDPGQGGGSVDSVNGQTGDVVLDAGDLEFDDTETYAAGSVGAELSQQKNAIGELATFSHGKNLWNPDELLIGKYYNNQFQTDSNFRAIILDVESGDIVTCSYKSGNGNQAVANIYSVGIYNGSTLSNVVDLTGTNTYTVPENVTRIGVCVRTGTYGYDIQIEITTDGQYTAYEAYREIVTLDEDVIIPEIVNARGTYQTLDDRLDVIDEEIEELQPEADELTTFNLFDFSKWTDGFIKADGTITGSTAATASSTHATSEFIPAIKGDTFVCSARGVTGVTSQLAPIGYYAEYDESKSLLRYVNSNQNSVQVQNANAAYVRMTIRIATYGTMLKVEKNIYGLFTSYRDNTVYKNLAKPSYIFIPKYIYAAVGRTIEIYNDQIVLGNENYHIQYICDVGVAMKRKFTLTATSAMLTSRSDSNLSLGQYRLFVNIYDNDNQLVWQGCSIIWIKAALSSAKTVIPIGDSLTNWKKWLPEVINLSSNNLTFVGTRYSGADQDASGNDYASGTIHHEGRSGWSAASYLANTEYTFDNRYDGVSSVLGSANPFWDGTDFSFEHYLTTQGKSVPDAVQIWLGTNDIADGIEPSVANIVTMVNSIRAEYPTLKIIICNTIYRSNQDGYASVGSDGYVGAGRARAYAYDENVKVMQLAEKLTLALLNMENVYIVPLYCSHDTEYNFGWVEYHPNPRAEQIVHIPSESVHPSIQGYWQLADIIFSAYSVLL